MRIASACSLALVIGFGQLAAGQVSTPALRPPLHVAATTPKHDGPQGPLRQVLISVHVWEFAADDLKDFKVETQAAAAPANARPAMFPKAPGCVLDQAGLEALSKALLGKSVHILCEPKLACLTGRPASLVAGGELPYITGYQEGKPVFAYREEGARIDVVAESLPDDKLRLDIRIRASTIDPTHSLTTQGMTIPAFDVRSLDTQLELKLGQTYVSGLTFDGQSIRPVSTDRPAEAPSSPGKKMQTIFMVTAEPIAIVQ